MKRIILYRRPDPAAATPAWPQKAVVPTFEDWCEANGWKCKRGNLDLVRDYLAEVASSQGILETISPTKV